MQLKNFYKYIANYKLELLKGIIWILLIFNNKKLYRFFYSSVRNQYGMDNIDYIFRITIMIVTGLLILLGVLKLFQFLKRNAESLLVVGVTEADVLKLFFVKNYDLLLGFLFIKYLFGLLYKQNSIRMLAVNLMGACILGMLMILFYIAVQYKYVRLSFDFILILFSLCLVRGYINYENVYRVLTSEALDYFFYDFSWFRICCRILFIGVLSILLRKSIKQRGIIADIDSRKRGKLNLAGDFFHKWGNYSAIRIDYFWIYRDHDFIIWKIFSTIVFAFFSVQYGGVWEQILCGYVICLVTTSYFLNIYKFERKHLIVYFMSDFTFLDFLKMHVKSSMIVAGDNIIAVLILNSLRDHTSLVSAFILCLLIFLIVLFVDTAIYVKYPHKIYMFDWIAIIVKMHIPVLNVRTWYRNCLEGKIKWSALEYEKE